MDELIACLPDIPFRKILKYYIYEKSKNSGITWTNEHDQINDFPMFCHIYDNLMPHGFVKIDSKITFGLIRKRFPNINLVDPVNLRKIVDDCWPKIIENEYAFTLVTFISLFFYTINFNHHIGKTTIGLTF
jgi:hypothetical protein